MYHQRLIQKGLAGIRSAILYLRTLYFQKVWGMDIGEDVQISLKAKLDRRNPKGIKIGDGTYIAFGAVLLCHDMARNLSSKVTIGKNCHIGANSIILPGVVLGDEVVVAAGSVVTKSIDGNCIIAGNPAKPIKQGIRTVKWGRIANYYPKAAKAANAIMKEN